MSGAVDLSVIIVCHRQEHMLPRCVSSLERGLQGVRSELIVLDNLNRGLAKEHLTGSALHHTVVANRRPRGLGYNINRAAAESEAEYILQLNPDMVHHDGRVAEAVEFMEGRPDAGVVCCRLLYPDGRPQPSYRRFPTVPVVVGRGLKMESWPWVPGFYRRRMMLDVVLEEPAAVDWVFGAFMLMRREQFNRLGGMDPALFIYYTYVDMCYRYGQAGLRSYVFPRVRFLHEHQRTSARMPFGRYWRSHVRSAVRYFRKHRYWLVPRTGGPRR